jgi:hypothetical protein
MSIFDRTQEQLTREQEIARGLHAAQLLRDDVLQAALEYTEFAWLSTWHDSTSPAERDKCWAVIHAIGEVRRTLDGFVDDGVKAGDRR